MRSSPFSELFTHCFDDLNAWLGLSREQSRIIPPTVKFRLLVELDAPTKRWSAVFPELPGCASAGDTEAEAIANAKEALALWFEPTPVKLRKNAKLIELTLP